MPRYSMTFEFDNADPDESLVQNERIDDNVFQNRRSLCTVRKVLDEVKAGENTQPATMSFRRLVKPQDLNSANTLFGGTLMSWIDEASAMYSMCQMQTQRVVTLKVSEVLFKTPAFQGDILEMYCSTLSTGRTSLGVRCFAIAKGAEEREARVIATCDLVFVSVDRDFRPTPFAARGRPTPI